MLEKTKQLITYLIKHNNYSITSLMKLSYLMDLVSIKKRVGKISDFDYRCYKHGPFDRKIYDYITELIDSNIIFEDVDYSPYEEFIIYKLTDNSNINFSKLSNREINIIDEVLESLKGYSAKMLTDVAYETKPMKAIGAKQGSIKNLNVTLNLNAK